MALKNRYGLFILFFVVVALLPLFVRSPYWISTLVFVGLFTILTVGLCLLLGYAGQISLGHNAFYGLGAYASAIVTVRMGLPPWLGFLVSVLATGGLAAILAKPVFRLRGHFLALATLGLGLIFYVLFNEATGLTGGPSGLSGVPYLSVGPIVFDQDTEYYYLVWGMVAAILLVSLNLVNSRVGRALRALRDSEVAAETMGADTARLKAQIFVISCVYAGLAGSLYAHYVTFVNPTPFGLNTSLMLLVMAAIGGMRSIWGAPLGAAVVTFLTEVLRSVVPRLSDHASGEYEIIIFGILLIVIMRWMPEGVALKGGQIGRWFVAQANESVPHAARLSRGGRPARRPGARQGIGLEN
jgi:branched-chain amino acid transport system permease protein